MCSSIFPKIGLSANDNLRVIDQTAGKGTITYTEGGAAGNNTAEAVKNIVARSNAGTYTIENVTFKTN